MGDKLGDAFSIGTGGWFVSDAVGPSAPDITVIGLTTTSVRVTFSNSAAGVTNYAVYALSTDGGNTWSAGGNRSGDGTVDISGLTAASEYFFAGYSQLDGANSLFSNIAEYKLGYDPSTAHVLYMGYPKLLEQRTVKEKTEDYTIYQYKYELGVNQTLAQASLDEGDYLPEDATAIIISAQLTKSPGKANNMAVVTAQFQNEWTD